MSPNPTIREINDAINRLRAKKEAARISNKKISDNSDGTLSEAAVQRFFSGDSADPSMQTFIEVAHALGMTTAEAFGVKPEEHKGHDHAVCLERIADQKKLYEDRIADQKAHYESQLEQTRMRFKEQISTQKEIYDHQSHRQTVWLIALFSAFLTLVLLIIFFVVYDVTHPTMGWVQYAPAVLGNSAETTLQAILFLRRFFHGIV